eukprot:SAG31_NODE_2417_length_5729_cov_2.939432_1_plen_170_part_00
MGLCAPKGAMGPSTSMVANKRGANVSPRTGSRASGFIFLLGHHEASNIPTIVWSDSDAGSQHPMHAGPRTIFFRLGLKYPTCTSVCSSVRAVARILTTAALAAPPRGFTIAMMERSFYNNVQHSASTSIDWPCLTPCIRVWALKPRCDTFFSDALQTLLGTFLQPFRTK